MRPHLHLKHALGTHAASGNVTRHIQRGIHPVIIQLTKLNMPPKATTSSKPAKLSPQEVPAQFQRYRTELQNLAQKIGELESELEEHACVSWRSCDLCPQTKS